MSSLIYRVNFAAFGLLFLGACLPWLAFAQEADTASTTPTSSTTEEVVMPDGRKHTASFIQNRTITRF